MDTTLSMDSQRATILIGGFIAMVFLPETNLLPFDWGGFWFIAVLLLYMPFYIGYMKLNAVNPVDLAVTPKSGKGIRFLCKRTQASEYFRPYSALGWFAPVV